MTCCNGSSFVPAPDATLDPSQRVNFTFGMVLGVDDFRQEHLYLAARDQRALAATVGYGIVAGLDVACLTDKIAGKTSVRVEPGLALLPDGHLVAVSSAQCASLDEWLADWLTSQKNLPDRVYVVLRFDATSGTPVPIPGEPCRAEGELQADSRISDGFRLDFSPEPPDTREDDALRSFAAWLRTVEVVGGPAAAAEDGRLNPGRLEIEKAARDRELVGKIGIDRGRLDAFLRAVEKTISNAIARGWPEKILRPTSEVPLAEPVKDLAIPYGEYAEYMQAAFALWIDTLRWQYLKTHYDLPATSETRLLLAGIDLAGDQPVAILRGRPQVVHLRLLQEWLLNKPDDAPRDAHYVLGRSDPRLPAAQDLNASFAEAAHRLARVDPVDGDGIVRPAVIWPGTAEAPADYYGPVMDAPIPVADGGTGQSAAPAPGQLLVGAPESSPAGLPAFTLGTLRAAQHGEGETLLANLAIDPTSQAPDIVLDTIQDIDPDASPAFAGLTVDGAITARSLRIAADAGGGDGDGTLTVTALDSAVIASDADGRLIKARHWDGNAEDLASGAIYYYAPGQGEPVRIEEGGSGLSARPQPLQVLVGHNGAAPPAYVLANLVAGKNVSLTLVQERLPDTPLQPPGNVLNVGDRLPLGDRVDLGLPLDRLPAGKLRQVWNLQIDASGGSDLTLPLTAAQGGTGQTAAPQTGQILVGDGSSFVLGQIAAADAARNLTVSASAAGVMLNTAQNIDQESAPTFAALQLTKPSDRRATHNLGWNDEKGEVVIGPLAGVSSRQVVVAETPDEFGKLLERFDDFAGRDVVVVYRSDKPFSSAKAPPPRNDGQWLTLKSLAGAGSLALDSGLIEGGSIRLDAGGAVTLVASSALKLWLLVGRF